MTTSFNFKNLLNQRLTYLSQWLRENKIGSNPEKIMSIAKDLFWSAVDNNIEEKDVKTIKTKLASDGSFQFKEGNLWQSLSDYFHNPAYVQFFKDISELEPKGMRTSPNACCGKYELLYRLLRPNSQQPKKGDILDNNAKIELKGSEVRISSFTITGRMYKSVCDDIFKDAGIQPNLVFKTKDKYAYEIEKVRYVTHYQQEFSKIGADKAKELVTSLLKKLNMNATEKEINNVFFKDVYQPSLLIDIYLRNFFEDYQQKDGFDYMILFGNGTDVKMIHSYKDLTKCQKKSDYFRISQNTNIAWYIE